MNNTTVTIDRADLECVYEVAARWRVSDAPGTCGEYERVKGLAILNALYTLGLADEDFQLSC